MITFEVIILDNPYFMTVVTFVSILAAIRVARWILNMLP